MYFLLQQVWCINFNINKFTPCFFMPRESLHEASIAIATAVLATSVRIDYIVKDP